MSKKRRNNYHTPINNSSQVEEEMQSGTLDIPVAEMGDEEEKVIEVEDTVVEQDNDIIKVAISSDNLSSMLSTSSTDATIAALNETKAKFDFALDELAKQIQNVVPPVKIIQPTQTSDFDYMEDFKRFKSEMDAKLEMVRKQVYSDINKLAIGINTLDKKTVCLSWQLETLTKILKEKDYIVQEELDNLSKQVYTELNIGNTLNSLDGRIAALTGNQ